MSQRVRGTVIHYDHQLGLGAIDADVLDEPIIVCAGVIEAAGYAWLEEGECVEFELVWSYDMPAADELVVVSPASAGDSIAAEGAEVPQRDTQQKRWWTSGGTMLTLC